MTVCYLKKQLKIALPLDSEYEWVFITEVVRRSVSQRFHVAVES